MVDKKEFAKEVSLKGLSKGRESLVNARSKKRYFPFEYRTYDSNRRAEVRESKEKKVKKRGIFCSQQAPFLLEKSVSGPKERAAFFIDTFFFTFLCLYLLRCHL